MTVLKPSRSQSAVGCGCLWLLTLLWNTILLVLALPAGLLAIGAGLTLSRGLFSLIFLAVNSILISLSVYGTYAYLGQRRLLTAPSITISDIPLRPGAAFEVTYAQTFRRAVAVQGIAIRLVQRETAISLRGPRPSERTPGTLPEEVPHPGRHFARIQPFQHQHEQIVAEAIRPAQRYQAGQTFRERHIFRLPPDAMHTFIGEHNRVEWLISIQIKLAGWPDVLEEYPVEVQPELEQAVSYGAG